MGTKEKRAGGTLTIDEGNLHEEWFRQADLFHAAALELAELKHELDQAESQKEVVAAELKLNIRHNPSKYQLPKVTEGALDELVTTSSRYAACVEAVNTLKYKVAVAKAMVDALDQKKRALEKLVDLFLSDYWSDPRTSNMGGMRMEKEKNKKTRRRDDD